MRFIVASGIVTFLMLISFQKGQAQIQNDIGCFAIDSPASSFCGSVKNIFVRVENYGTTRVDSFMVNWSVNGTLQPSVKYLIVLDTAGGTGSTTAGVSLGSLALALNTPTQIKVWTSLPNAVTDSNRVNDTVQVTRTAVSMSGNYTINPAGTGATNFVSIDDAISALTSYGICGPTTLTMAAGVYLRTSPVIIGDITGTSTFKTVTFKGASKSTCIVRGTLPGSAVFIASQTRYIVVRDLTIINDATTDPVAFAVTGITKKVAIINCSMEVPVVSGTSQVGYGLNLTSITSGYGQGGCVIDSVLVDSNHFTGGAYGICVTGSSLNTKNYDIVIRNNTIDKCNDIGISVSYVFQPVQVCNNRISLNGDTAARFGIYFEDNKSYNTTKGHIISGNYILNYGEMGIYCSYPCVMTTTAAILISNNVTVSSVLRGMNGIYLRQLTGTTANVYHNTVVVRNDITAATTHSAFRNVGSEKTRIKNNLFLVFRGEHHAVYLSANVTSSYIDHNVYYTPGSSKLIYKSNVSYDSTNYKFVGGEGSRHAVPLFQYFSLNSDSMDLAMRSCKSPRGENLNALVPTDLSGLVRTAAPTIGAYEYVPYFSHNLAPTAILFDSTVIYIPGSSYDLKYTVVNEGSDTVLNYTAGYRQNLLPPVTLGRTVNLPPCQTDTIVFSGAKQIPISAHNAITLYTSDVNNTADEDKRNDTLNIKRYSGLSGTYIVGPPPSDFNKPLDALAVLYEVGVYGKVNFLMKTGTYTEALDLDSVPGASHTNTVTLTSQANHADSVVISRGAASLVKYVVKFKTAASFFLLEKMTISQLNVISNCNAILLEGRASFDTIRQCKITQPLISAYTDAVTINATDYEGSSLCIKDNSIDGGYTSIQLKGVSRTNPMKHVTVSGNTISGFYMYFQVYWYSNGGAFSGNTIHQHVSSVNGFEGSFQYIDSGFKSIGNIINTTNSNFLYWTYYFSRNTAANKCIIANNVVAGPGSTNFMVGSQSSYMDILHNTLHCNQGYFRVQTGGSTSNTRILNNLITTSGTSVPSYYMNAVPLSSVVSDHNLVYNAAGSTYGVSSTDYSPQAFKATFSPREKNSVGVHSGYTSVTNPAPDPTDSASWALNGMGTHIGYVLNDFNNNPRPQTYIDGAPDIGAYEFTPVSVPKPLTAVPTTPVPNSVQAFLLGTDTMAKITWFAAVPTTIKGTMYTGVYPPGIDGNTDKSLQEYWDFNTAPGTYNCNIGLYYRAPLRGSIPTVLNMMGAKKSVSGSWTFYPAPATTVDTTKKILAITGLTHLSVFTGTDATTPLPVELIRFSAAVKGSGAELTWVTASEQQLSHFEVFASDDGIHYDQIGMPIRSKGVATSMNGYRYADLNAFERTDVRYYKLRSIDFNGDFSWSEVRVVKKGTTNNTTDQIYPNPFSDRFFIVVPQDVMSKVTIFSLQGEVVFNETLRPEQGIITIDNMDGITPGIYFLSVVQGNDVFTQKLFK